MPSKEHVRELRCKRSKRAYSDKFDKFDKKTSVFFKELVFELHLAVLSKKRMDVHSTSLLLN